MCLLYTVTGTNSPTTDSSKTPTGMSKRRKVQQQRASVKATARATGA
jgi:hypothetical protein